MDGKKYKYNELSCSTHPHQVYVQAISEVGILGFIVFLLAPAFLLFLVIRETWSRLYSSSSIISDYQILPSITATRNIAPNKWFDELSVPDKNDKYFHQYKKFFIDKLSQQSIETVYVVGNKELYLKDMFNQECSKKNRISEIALKINIKNCLN